MPAGAVRSGGAAHIQETNAMATATAINAARPMTGEERKGIFASSLGTVFEWYDF